MKKIIIQEEISITQKEVDETIKRYENMPDSIKLGILCSVLDKKGIIKEIKKLSKLGKAILLIDYNYNKFEKQRGKDERTQNNKKS